MIYSKTNLIRGLSDRLGTYFLSTPDTLGTTTTLIDASLDQYIPGDISKLNIWVYGAEGVASANRGIERRARTWTQGTHTLVFYTAWPTAVTAVGTYEIHTRFKRAQVAEAINSALRLLGHFWYREFVDDTLTSISGQYRYTLPSTQGFGKIKRIDVQVNTETADYPYASAATWGWDIIRSTDDGVEVDYIQFDRALPADRTIRIYGEGYFQDLVYDSDTIDMDGKWAGPMLEWIYDYAQYQLSKWAGNRSNQGDVEKYRVKELQTLMEARQMLQDLIRPQTGGRILVPGMGAGDRDSWHYMGWFKSDAFV